MILVHNFMTLYRSTSILCSPAIISPLSFFPDFYQTKCVIFTQNEKLVKCTKFFCKSKQRKCENFHGNECSEIKLCHAAFCVYSSSELADVE